MIGLLLSPHTVASGESGGGPTGSPSSLSQSFYGGGPSTGYVRLSWVNGDASAATDVGYTDDVGAGPFVLHTVGPGTSAYETGLRYADTTLWTWMVRHVKNGITTEWVV